MLGENPATAFAKAASDPKTLTDDELMVLAYHFSIWTNLDDRGEMLMDEGLASPEQNVNYWKGHAHTVFGGNTISKALWQRLRDNTSGGREWVSIVDEEMKNVSGDGLSALLNTLREAAGQE